MSREKLTLIRKSFGFRLNVELVTRLKHVALDKGKAVNVIMEEAINELLKKYEKKQR